MDESRKAQNELNDILIKRERVEENRLKNILLIVAALLLFVIIGILAFRIIDAGAKEDAQVEATTPQITEHRPSQYSASSAPEVDSTNKTLDEILAKHNREKEARVDESLDKVAITEEKIDLKEPSKFVEIKDEPKPEPVKAEPKPEPKKVEPKRVEQPKVAEPVKIEPKPEPKKPEPKKESPKDGSFFVQVESLEKEPRAEYINELKAKGFGVVVKDKVIDGKTKKRVYVGPYNTREEAAAVLPKIKREINPDAFVIQD